jgi:hypothetical protein
LNPNDVTNYSKSITPLQSLSNNSYIIPISSYYYTLSNHIITFLNWSKESVGTSSCKNAATNSSICTFDAIKFNFYAARLYPVLHLIAMSLNSF